MAKSTFTRTKPDGTKQTRVAHTPAEAVKLRFEGWKEVTDAARSKQAREAAKPADSAPTPPAPSA